MPPPFHNLDFLLASSPLAHEGLAGLADINGGGAHRGAAVVIYHIDARLPLILNLVRVGIIRDYVDKV